MRKIVSIITAIALIFSLVLPPEWVRAQGIPASAPITITNLPAPGAMIGLTPAYTPAMIKGIRIDPKNPLRMDFIVHIGDDKLQGEDLKSESTQLIKYFLTAMTVPEDEMWVNLSPYEKNRIVPDSLGRTDMGRDLLAQDYLLKQLTASLVYPEDELGDKFWKRIRKRAREEYGTDDIPTNVFNKVWIVPEKAIVYVEGQTAFVTEHHLKVMLEEDYLASGEDGRGKMGDGKSSQSSIINSPSSNTTNQIIREIILPAIEHEVNHGKNFAKLRQIFNSVILATWYKKNLKQSLLGQKYADQNKVNGLENGEDNATERIYNQYVAAFKQGVYDYIKEDYDAQTQEIIPRKYFSGGVDGKNIDPSTAGGEGRASRLGKPEDLVEVQFLAGLVDTISDAPLIQSTLKNQAKQRMMALRAHYPDRDVFVSEASINEYLSQWGDDGKKLDDEESVVVRLNDDGTVDLLGGVNRAIADDLKLRVVTVGTKVKTPDGKSLLMVRRPSFKRAEPKRLVIPTGYAKFGIPLVESALEEVREELGFPGDYQFAGEMRLESAVATVQGGVPDLALFYEMTVSEDDMTEFGEILERNNAQKRGKTRKEYEDESARKEKQKKGSVHSYGAYVVSVSEVFGQGEVEIPELFTDTQDSPDVVEFGLPVRVMTQQEPFEGRVVSVENLDQELLGGGVLEGAVSRAEGLKESPPGSPAAVFDALGDGGLTLAQLSERLGPKESTLQKDITDLNQLGLLKPRKRGSNDPYELTDEALAVAGTISRIFHNLPKEGARRSRPTATYREGVIKPQIQLALKLAGARPPFNLDEISHYVLDVDGVILDNSLIFEKHFSFIYAMIKNGIKDPEGFKPTLEDLIEGRNIFMNGIQVAEGISTGGLGNPTKETIRGVIEKLSNEGVLNLPESVDELHTYFNDLYVERRNAYVEESLTLPMEQARARLLKPGVIEFLEEQKRLDKKVYVLSRASREERMPVFQALGLMEYFEDFVFVERAEMKIDEILALPARWGVTPNNIVLVDDAPIVARELYKAQSEKPQEERVWVVGMPNTFEHAEQVGSQVDHMAMNLGDLIEGESGAVAGDEIKIKKIEINTEDPFVQLSLIENMFYDAEADIRNETARQLMRIYVELVKIGLMELEDLEKFMSHNYYSIRFELIKVLEEYYIEQIKNGQDVDLTTMIGALEDNMSANATQAANSIGNFFVLLIEDGKEVELDIFDKLLAGSRGNKRTAAANAIAKSFAEMVKTGVMTVEDFVNKGVSTNNIDLKEAIQRQATIMETKAAKETDSLVRQSESNKLEENRYESLSIEELQVLLESAGDEVYEDTFKEVVQACQNQIIQGHYDQRILSVLINSFKDRSKKIRGVQLIWLMSELFLVLINQGYSVDLSFFFDLLRHENSTYRRETVKHVGNLFVAMIRAGKFTNGNKEVYNFLHRNNLLLAESGISPAFVSSISRLNASELKEKQRQINKIRDEVSVLSSDKNMVNIVFILEYMFPGGAEYALNLLRKGREGRLNDYRRVLSSNEAFEVLTYVREKLLRFQMRDYFILFDFFSIYTYLGKPEFIRQQFAQPFQSRNHFYRLLNQGVMKLFNDVNEGNPDDVKYEYFNETLDASPGRVKPYVIRAGLMSSDRFTRRQAAKMARKVEVVTDALKDDLIEALKDIDLDVVQFAARSLAEVGDERSLVLLNEMLKGAPEKVVLYVYDDHGSMVAYTEKDDAKGITRDGFVLKEKKEQDNPLIGYVTSTIAAITERIDQRREDAKLDLDSIQDERLVKFLKFLEENGLQDDIVVVGGGVRDAHAGKRLNDIDINVRIPLTDQEHEDFLPTRALANERVYQYAVDKLSRLAAVLGVEVEKFLPPTRDGAVMWEGVEIQYTGPVLLKQEVEDRAQQKDIYLKRIIVSESGWVYSSNTGATLLQLALDSSGRLYGHVEALEDFDKEILRLAGNRDNLTLGDVLRLMILKYEFELYISQEDYEIIEQTIQKYIDDKLPLNKGIMKSIVQRQLNKVMARAKDKQMAYDELEKLGILALIKSKLGLDFSLEVLPDGESDEIAGSDSGRQAPAAGSGQDPSNTSGASAGQADKNSKKGKFLSDWNWKSVQMDQVNSEFDQWVASGGMDSEDLHILEKILSGEEKALREVLTRYRHKVKIKKEDRDNPMVDGRTVYLELSEAFLSSTGEISILRIKGGRPHYSANLVELESHNGSGVVREGVGVNKEGSLFVKGRDYSRETFEIEKYELAPQGAILKDHADREYEMMEEGTFGNRGFYTDYPIATGVWVGKTHAGRSVGFVIAGMRDYDFRVNIEYLIDVDNMIENVVSGRRRGVSQDQGYDIYQQVGRSLREYHDAGYFHRFPHNLNLGLEMREGSELKVVMRDLDTTVTREDIKPKNANKRKIAYRLLDLQRVVADLSSESRAGYFLGDDEVVSRIVPFVRSFLEGYFHELDPTSDEFDVLLREVSSMTFAGLIVEMKGAGEGVKLNADVRHGNINLGMIWQKLYDASMKAFATPGGIDLNPTTINLQVEGGEVQFTVPAVPAYLQNIQINGLVPVIINIAPVTNMNMLFGNAAEPVDEEDEDRLVLTVADRKRF